MKDSVSETFRETTPFKDMELKTVKDKRKFLYSRYEFVSIYETSFEQLDHPHRFDEPLPADLG